VVRAVREGRGYCGRSLGKAIQDVEKGLIDAQLGGGVIKQRIAREGEGASGGFRSIVLYKQGEKAFFVFGFAKNQRDTIKPDEFKYFRNSRRKCWRWTTSRSGN